MNRPEKLRRIWIVWVWAPYPQFRANQHIWRFQRIAQLHALFLGSREGRAGAYHVFVERKPMKPTFKKLTNRLSRGQRLANARCRHVPDVFAITFRARMGTATPSDLARFERIMRAGQRIKRIEHGIAPFDTRYDAKLLERAE